MRYSPKPLSSQSDARDRARDFGALFAHVLLQTVAPWARFVVKPVWREPWTDSTWILSAVRSDEEVAFELSDGSWLFAGQTLGVRRSDRDGNLWLTTLRYKYRWQANESDDSWLIRWDYVREPRSPEHPRAHVHVNAVPEHYQAGRDAFARLHIPAGRVGIEDVAAFLLRDHGVRPVSDTSEEVIEEARLIFARIQGRLPP